jgi:hypothetical protein
VPVAGHLSDVRAGIRFHDGCFREEERAASCSEAFEKSRGVGSFGTRSAEVDRDTRGPVSSPAGFLGATAPRGWAPAARCLFNPPPSLPRP